MADVIEAAGGVLWRSGPHGREFAVIHRPKYDDWTLAKGKLDPGETHEQAAVREVAEETGVNVAITGLVGLYTDPGHVMAYDDGEVRQEFSVCFRARAVGGEPLQDNTETKAAKWAEPAELDGLSIHPSMRRRITDALANRDTPHIG